MTIFAVICAGIFPLIHVGRPWLAYWLVPYPNQMASGRTSARPLLWDVFAVSTYFTVSLLFWYLGLLPDLASLRDRADQPDPQARLRLPRLGWRGASQPLAALREGLPAPGGPGHRLVLSVHSVVSFDFATSIVPGWHMTIFPPYFVVGAIFAGFAMVLMVLIVVRETMDLKNLITDFHLEVMCKVILGMSCLMGYAYVVEAFIAWYSAEHLHPAHLHELRHAATTAGPAG